MNRRDLVRKLFALPAIAVIAPMPVIKSYHGRWDDVLAVSLEIDADEDTSDEEMTLILMTLKEKVREEAGRDVPCFWCRGVRVRFHTTIGDAETEVASGEIVKSLLESGDVAGAQSVILRDLQKDIGNA